MDPDAEVTVNQAEWLRRLFTEGSKVPTETLVLRARERTSSMKQLQAWLRSYQRSLDLQLHELVQGNYGSVQALHARNLALRHTLLQLRPQLATLKLDVAAVVRAIVAEQRALQARVENARLLAQRQRILQRALNVTRALAKLESLLAALPPETPLTQSSAADAHTHHSSHELERVARALGQLQYAASEGAQPSALMLALQPRLRAHGTALETRLDAEFRSALSAPLPYDEAASLRLSTLLRAYAALRRTEHCATLIGEILCAASVRAAVSRANMLAIQMQQSPGEPAPTLSSVASFSTRALLESYEAEVRVAAFPLQQLCDELLTLAEHTLLPLARLAAAAAPEAPLAVFARAWWPLVDEVWQRQLAGVFVPSPTRPQLFHAHYTLAHAMVARLEALAPSRAELLAMRDASACKAFLRRWNCTAYFMLRARDLTSRFDSALDATTLSARAPEPCDACVLAASCAMLQCVAELWAPTWHLDALAYRAFRLTMELVLRFSHWLHAQLDTLFSAEHAPLTHAATLVAALAELVPLRAALLALVTHALTTCPESVLAPCRAALEGLLAAQWSRVVARVRDALVRALCEACGAHVAEVRSVASAYRLTGQRVDARTAPSPYARALFAPLHNFAHAYATQLGESEWMTWLCEVVESVLTRLIEQAQSMLASERQKDALISKVNKTARTRPTSAASEADSMSDADKMATQLGIDVDAVLDTLRSLNVPAEALKGLLEWRRTLLPIHTQGMRTTSSD